MVIRGTENMQVCLAGLEDSGKRVLISLLYGSMIRYSEEKESGFRFSTSTDHQMVLGENFNNLRGGLWPYRPYPERLKITMRFREKGLSGWMKKNLARKNTTIQNDITITVRDIPRVSDEESWEDESENVKELPGSKLTLLVLDYTSLRNDKESVSELERVFRKTIDWRGSKTTPTVILTMCDGLKSKKMEKMGIPEGIPSPKENETRKKVGLSLVKEGSKSLRRLLKSYDPEFFFLGLMTEKNDDGEIVPKLNPDIENELEYPYEEYKALIEHIGKFDIKQ